MRQTKTQTADIIHGYVNGFHSIFIYTPSGNMFSKGLCLFWTNGIADTGVNNVQSMDFLYWGVTEHYCYAELIGPQRTKVLC